MPIYEFTCQRCGKEFERLVFASDHEAIACPECGSEETRKHLSVFASCGVEKPLSQGCSSSSGHK